MEIKDILEFKLIKLIGDEAYKNITEMELNYILEDSSLKIKNYCNRNDIPKELNIVWADMAIDVFKVYNLALFKESDQKELESRIKSVDSGDTSLEFDTDPDSLIKKADMILYSYTSQLNKFRLFKRMC